jgi:hypothetical protein
VACSRVTFTFTILLRLEKIISDNYRLPLPSDYLPQHNQWTANSRDGVLLPNDKRQLTNKLRTLFLLDSNCQTLDYHSDILSGHRSCGAWVSVWRFGHRFCHHRHVALHCCDDSNSQVLVADRSSRHKLFLPKLCVTGARFWVFSCGWWRFECCGIASSVFVSMWRKNARFIDCLVHFERFELHYHIFSSVIPAVYLILSGPTGVEKDSKKTQL